jgi:hypothetical protein
MRPKLSPDGPVMRKIGADIGQFLTAGEGQVVRLRV